MGKLIIAEDSQRLRKNIKRLIGLSGYPESSIDEAENGEILVNMVRSESYSLVLTDYMMPKINGVEAIRKIREFDPYVPICLMSSDMDEVLGRLAIEAGANHYLSKTDSAFLDQLEAIVKQYVPV